MKSCLYECSVMHRRLEPKEHSFRYNVFMFYLDLDEIDEVCRETPGLSRNRWNIYTFRDDDHFQTGIGTAKERLIFYLKENGIAFPSDGRIRLLTLPRVLGYIFNPVSLYFCFDAEDAAICSVAEVGNTFGESKPFLLREPAADGRFRLTAPKHFYVSPFSSLELQFDFNLSVPADALDVHIDDLDGNKKVLLSVLTGKREPLTSLRLAWFTLKYPLITLKVIVLIHWQAFLLWGKGLPWHSKHADPELQRGVLNPRTP